MDVKYVNPFVNAAQNVFQTMLNLELKVNTDELTVSKGAAARHDVSGIIGLSGDVIGAVILSFPRQSACRIATVFAGSKMTEEHEDFADAIGELANMIAGNAKKDLDGLNITISTPSVVIGQDHIVKGQKAMPRLIIPCSTQAGSFVIEVGMQKVDKPTQTELATANVG